MLRALIIAIGLVLTAQVSAAQPAPASNVTITKTLTWDALDAASCVPLCQYRIEIDGASVTTVSAPPATFPAPMVIGVHVASVTAIDGMGRESARSVVAYYESNGPALNTGPCMYQAPTAGAPMETRPKGQMMQGFNPIGPSGIAGNQADRIRQLQLWGWQVTLSQFVEGNLRPDRTDRLFLIVECKGL